MNQHKERALQWLKGAPKRFLIGGQWIEGSGLRHFDVVDPATEAVLASLPEANTEVVRQSAQAARDAFQLKSKGAWSAKSRRERSEALKKIAELVRKHADELAAIETLANGKTFKEARFDDLPESADVFDYYAGWTDKFYAESVPVDPPFMNYTVHEPVGVVGLIVPWNFPLLLGCWKLAPALAMGNTVVMKPASNTSHSMIRLFEIIHEAGVLPPGVLNLVYGDGEPGSAISASPLIDKVSFTGSTVVGKKILAGSSQSNLKSVTLELGGKSPNIIFGDAADLDAVAQRCFTAMFCHKGEKCSEPTRFIVHSSIYDKFAAKLVSMAEAYKVGDPFSEETDQGAQANRQHFEKIMGYIEKGKKEGAKLLTGGSKVTGINGGKGFFVRPTIFGDVKNSMTIAQEEIFGPVLCLIKFETEEEAVTIANDTQYGLAAGFYSSDASRCQRVARQLDAGMVFINHYGCYDFASPFGGFKQSGWGKEMAIHSLSAYTKTKSIWMKY